MDKEITPPDTFTTWNGTECKWIYEDEERPDTAECHDCGLDYSYGNDLALPQDVWEKINPTHHKTAGILCANCIIERLAIVNLYGIEATIWPDPKYES